MGWEGIDIPWGESDSENESAPIPRPYADRPSVRPDGLFDTIKRILHLEDAAKGGWS
jgi:hypothetical protein